METQYISLNMTPTGVNPCFHISQYDVGRTLGFIVHSGGATVDLDTYTCTIEATRSDGTAITSAVATTDNIGTFEVTPTMSNKADKYRCQLVIVDENSKRIASLPFDMEVTKAAMDENSESIEEDASLYQQYTEAVQGAIAEANAGIQAEENARIAAVSAEATARQTADATLQNNINGEATARQTADNTLQGNINSEAATRASADSNLQSQINQIIAPSGEAPSAAEVQNARIGADGATYDTLGSAIRGQVTDLKSALSTLVYQKTISRASIGRETVIFPIEIGNVISITNNGSTYIDVAFRASGSDTNLQLVTVSPGSTVDAVSTVNADCVSPYFQSASSITVINMSKRVPVLETEMADVIPSLNNAQDRLTRIDLHPYIPFEIGYVLCDASGFIYQDSSTRVRTKKGFTIELKTGDKVGLTDYSGKRYVLTRYDYTTESYKSTGWLTTAWTVESTSEGIYAVMIAYDPDATVSNVSDLSSLFYCNKNAVVGTPINVMSFNIGHFAYGQTGVGTAYKWGIESSIYADRLANWEDFFIKYNPDLLCMQEYSRCLDRVAEGETDADGIISTDTTIFDKMYSSKMECVTSGGAYCDTRAFTNCTLNDNTSVQLGGYGYCTYSHITIDGKKIAVVNFHASTTAAKRSSEFNALRLLLNNEKYAIICGDLNGDISELTGFLNHGYKVANGEIYSKRATYNSAIAYYCGLDETAKTSWYDFGKRVYERTTRNLAIDNIIVTQNIDVLDFKVCGDDFENLTSDHCAIYAELSVN
jgi:endonuclease/exonuclease/phosphatase family metal-dependent hydrolase